MVMRCQPVLDALRSVRGSAESGSAVSSRSTIVAALSPAGRQFTQKQAHRLSELDHLILICGHYEGMDERIYRHVDEEISIGDYVLTGGEIAAMAVSDAVIRLLPGALRSESTSEESFLRSRWPRSSTSRMRNTSCRILKRAKHDWWRRKKKISARPRGRWRRKTRKLRRR